MSRFGDVIGWSMTPSDMAVRVRDAMVHRVLELVGSSVRGDEVILECGVRAPRSEATETQDLVDCMACMLRRTTEAMETELAAYAEAELAAYKEAKLAAYKKAYP